MAAILDDKVVVLDRGSQNPQADLGRLAIIGQEQCMSPPLSHGLLHSIG
jgi:hypothetical protein